MHHWLRGDGRPWTNVFIINIERHARLVLTFCMSLFNLNLRGVEATFRDSPRVI